MIVFRLAINGVSPVAVHLVPVGSSSVTSHTKNSSFKLPVSVLVADLSFFWLFRVFLSIKAAVIELHVLF